VPNASETTALCNTSERVLSDSSCNWVYNLFDEDTVLLFTALINDSDATRHK
jgi:hypothetical protein